MWMLRNPRPVPVRLPGTLKVATVVLSPFMKLCFAGFTAATLRPGIFVQVPAGTFTHSCLELSLVAWSALWWLPLGEPQSFMPAFAMPAHFSQFLGWSGTASAELPVITVSSASTLAMVVCRVGFPVFIATSPLRVGLWPGLAITIQSEQAGDLIAFRVELIRITLIHQPGFAREDARDGRSRERQICL